MKLSQKQYVVLISLILLFMAIHANAAVVNTGGAYFNDFSAQPLTSDWATLSVAGSASDDYDMDADVNANVTAAGITGQLTAGTGNPPSATSGAMWNLSSFHIQTRPTGNRYTALMGKFVNQSETNATQVTISYQLTLDGTTATEDSGKGTRVYYSLTGAANNWTVIPALEMT